METIFEDDIGQLDSKNIFSSMSSDGFDFFISNKKSVSNSSLSEEIDSNSIYWLIGG